MDYHNGSLTLDEMEGAIEAEAIFEIDATWSRRSRNGMRSVDHVAGVNLLQWTFGGRKQDRETAVKLAGEEWVAHQEDLALTQWQETAEQDDADSYGDYAYELRRDYLHAAE